MPFLSTNVEGAGVLYDFTGVAPVYLLSNVVYLHTGGVPAIQMDVSGSNFVLAGTIYSEASAIGVTGGGAHNITVTATGGIYGNTAFELYGAAEISNNGVIETTSTGLYRGSSTGNVQFYNYGAFRVGNPSLTAIFLNGTNTDYILNAGSIIGEIFMGGGSDRLTNTGEIHGRVYLNDGDDEFTLAGGMMYGFVEGGLGNDIYTIDRYVDIRENVGEGTDTVFASVDFLLPRNVEALYLLGEATVGTGNGLNNSINGGDGDDHLDGRGGNDNLFGNDGDNTLRGGAGNDGIYAEDGDDLAYGGAGSDVFYMRNGLNRIYGEAGDDGAVMGADADLFDGGAGTDLVSWQDSPAGVTVNLLTGTGSGGWAEGDVLVSIENAGGSDGGNDVITGSNVANALYGLGGDDTLLGGGGDDTLNGGAGADILNGGAAVDTVDYAASTAIVVNLGTGAASGGLAAGDTLISIENVIGSSGDDFITGGNTANRLQGGSGNDTLVGGRGDDVLEGGVGNDTLTGSQDADIFLYAGVGQAAGWGMDSIMDFVDGVDRISFVGATGVSSMANLTITTQTGYVSIVTAGGAEIRLMGFTGTLDASDFIF